MTYLHVYTASVLYIQSIRLPHFARPADNSDSYTGSDDDDIMLDSDRYVAVTNYTRQAQDELSVSEGQVVYVVDDSDKSKSRSHMPHTWRHKHN